MLHGGSGIAADVRRQLAHETCVSKFNIGTELRMVFGKSLRSYLHAHPNDFDRLAILNFASLAMQREAIEILRALRHPSEPSLTYAD